MGRWFRRDPAEADEDFWALRDVSFEVEQGEALAIVGRNGAGKSTLLKILSRITEPTEGRIEILGRLSSLLEIGTGFHPELSGRENIFLNGTILGLRRREVQARFDAIVDFSGVEHFLDMPVKHYSSGMRMRLAFAVAAHLEPDILVVDEVLAVGDAEFQQKCLGKMSAARAQGRTVLFVSHNMAAVQALCSRGILLEAGRVAVDADIASCLARYLEHSSGLGLRWRLPAATERPDGLRIEEASLRIEGKQPRLRLFAELHLSSRGEHSPAFVAVDIWDSQGVQIMQAMPRQEGFIPPASVGWRLTIRVELPPLVPGRYLVGFWLGSHFTRTMDAPGQILAFEVIESPSPGRSYPHSDPRGFVVPESEVVEQAPL